MPYTCLAGSYASTPGHFFLSATFCPPPISNAPHLYYKTCAHPEIRLPFSYLSFLQIKFPMERPSTGLKLVLGDKAPYFSLKATDGRIYSIKDFEGSKAFVVIFTCNHCPYARAYESRILELATQYQQQGVKFVAVCANDPAGYPEDDFEHMVAKSKEWNFAFPYLQDLNQVMAEAYDAACTPEIYIFDHDLRLRYHGRVDDNHQDRSRVTESSMANALAAIMEGGQPEQPMTPVIGCSIKWTNR